MRRAKRDGTPTKPKREKVEGYQQVVDAFDAYFRAASKGSKPTWGAKQGAMVKRLLQAHGAADVLERIELLRTSPPSWPPGTWDLAALVKHFDLLVAQVQPKRRPASRQVTADGVVYGRYEPVEGADYSKAPWEVES